MVNGRMNGQFLWYKDNNSCICVSAVPFHVYRRRIHHVAVLANVSSTALFFLPVAFITRTPAGSVLRRALQDVVYY